MFHSHCYPLECARISRRFCFVNSKIVIPNLNRPCLNDSNSETHELLTGLYVRIVLLVQTPIPTVPNSCHIPQKLHQRGRSSFATESSRLVPRHWRPSVFRPLMLAEAHPDRLTNRRPVEFDPKRQLCDEFRMTLVFDCFVSRCQLGRRLGVVSMEPIPNGKDVRAGGWIQQWSNSVSTKRTFPRPNHRLLVVGNSEQTHWPNSRSTYDYLPRVVRPVRRRKIEVKRMDNLSVSRRANYL